MSFQKLRIKELRNICSGDPLLISILKEDRIAFTMLYEDSNETKEQKTPNHIISPLHVACSVNTSNFIIDILSRQKDEILRNLKNEILLNQKEKDKLSQEILNHQRKEKLPLKHLLVAIEEWYESEYFMMIRRAQFKIEKDWIKAISICDSSGQTPLHYLCRSCTSNKDKVKALLASYRGNFDTSYFNKHSVYDVTTGVEVLRIASSIIPLPNRNDSAIIKFGLKKQKPDIDFEILIPWLLKNIYKRCKSSITILEDQIERVQPAATSHRKILIPCEIRHLLFVLSVVVTDEIILELCRRYSGDSSAILLKNDEYLLQAQEKTSCRRVSTKKGSSRAKKSPSKKNSSSDEESDKEEALSNEAFLPKLEDFEFGLSVENLIADIRSEAAFKSISLRISPTQDILEDIKADYTPEELDVISLLKGNLNLVTVSAIRKSRREYLNYDDSSGRNALLYASAIGNTEVVKFLISEGASIFPSRTGESPLAVAGSGGTKAELERAFIDKISSGKFLVDQREHKGIMSEANGVPKEGETYVHVKSGDKGSMILEFNRLKEHRWEYSRSALGWAVSSGLESVARELMLDRCNINERDAQGRSPLHILCGAVNDPSNRLLHKSFLSLITALLEGGSDVNCQTICGQTPLHYLFLPINHKGSCVSNERKNEHRRELLRVLLTWSADSTIKDDSGLAPIHYCVKRNLVDCLKVFVSFGANIYKLTDAGDSILHLACKLKSYESVEYLTYYDADSSHGLITKVDSKGREPLNLLPANYDGKAINLWVAAVRGDNASVQRIVSSLDTYSIYQISKENSDKRTHAESTPAEGVDREEYSGNTVNDITSFSGTENEGKNDLYAEGINVKTRRMRWSSLHACLAGMHLSKAKSVKLQEFRYMSVLNFLIRSGAYVDSLDVNCRTPLMYAVMIDCVSAMVALVEFGADVTMRDLEGNTIFHLAYMYCSLACLRKLRGLVRSDEDSTNIAGKSPLETAGKGGNVSQAIFHSLIKKI